MTAQEEQAVAGYLTAITLPTTQGETLTRLPGILAEVKKRCPSILDPEFLALLDEHVNHPLATYGFQLSRGQLMAAIIAANKPPKPPKIVKVDHIGDEPHFTDLGNAERFIAQHGEDLRYSKALGWIAWDGVSWVNEDALAYQRAVQIVKDLYTEASQAEKPSERKTLADHAIKSEAAARIQSLLTVAGSLPDLLVEPSLFDARPWLLNCAGMTLDLQTGKSDTPKKEDYLIKRISTPYDPQATCPVWEHFLARVFGGNADLIDYIQRAVGYTLTGFIQEQVAFFCYGKGRNGKSTYLATLLALVGEYGHTMSMETLLMQKYGAVPSDLAELYGKRLWCAIEADQGRRLSEATIKQMTGDDEINACRKYHDPFTFMPIGKLWIAVNHKPIIKGRDLAIWRRIHLIPWNVTIAEAEVDHLLKEKLLAERPGILAWAVRGCLAWQQHGLKPPGIVIDATTAYRAEMDVIEDFLRECCDLNPRAEATAKELYTAYVAWLGRAEKPLPKKDFGLELKDRGFLSVHTRTGEAWRGLRVRSDLTPYSNPAGPAAGNIEAMKTGIFDDV